MKAISLLQPWAQLVVMGAKRIETRSWSTAYRGPLLIHASRKFTKEQEEISFQFSQQLNDTQIYHCHRGAIIGKVDLVGIIEFDKHRHEIENNRGVKFAADIFQFIEQELAFGDFGPGRYGWLLKNPKAFKDPIPYKGALSIWEFPDNLLPK
jgi:activating signal cointegrator 1